MIKKYTSNQYNYLQKGSKAAVKKNTPISKLLQIKRKKANNILSKVNRKAIIVLFDETYMK